MMKQCPLRCLASASKDNELSSNDSDSEIAGMVKQYPLRCLE